MIPRAPILDVTQEESDLGFSVVETETGVRVAAKAVAAGLLAVKMTTDAGGLEYIVCDRKLSPLYIVRSLHELMATFR